MKFEIPFNPASFKEENLAYFNYSWQPRIKNTRKLLIQAIVILCIGIAFLVSELRVANMGYIFIALGVHYTINCINYYLFVSRNRKKILQEIENRIAKYKNTIEIVEFSKENFHYESAGISLIISWDHCTGYKKITKDILAVYFISPALPSFFVNRKEISDEDFNHVISFLENKNWYPAAIPTL